MECLALNLNKEIGDCSKGGGGGALEGNPNPKGGGDGFIDRSKVRILLCDNNANILEEALTLLLKCSYQVISVRSASQVIDALNAEGPDIDIILAEVDIPMSKGMKMLKYIARDKELRRIPVIMMSAQDDVSIVVKCLRLGAADYLVKPLRTNELLNLWTHMWRRRRMLGLAEKNILNYEIDLVASDPSDANTTSTTLLSDDTDDRSKRNINPDGLSTHQENEPIAVASAPAPASAPSAFVVAFEPSFHGVRDCHPDVPCITDRKTGQLPPGPKKSELKVGESSAFFTYVKSSIARNSTQSTHAEGNMPQSVRLEERVHAQPEKVAINPQVHENGETWEKSSQGDDFPSSSSIHDSLSLERSCTPPGSADYLPQHNNYAEEKVPHMLVPPRNEHLDISGLGPQSGYPYYVSGVVNQVMMPSSAQMYQRNLHDLQNHCATTYQLPHCSSHMNGMASFPYYPVSFCLQPEQGPSTQSWPSFGNCPVLEMKPSNVDRREAALIKFRQKRKERCFDKKIRYVNRKRLAERRPRVRGQFVRKVNGVNVDLNGQPASADDDEDELEDEELATLDSSPENDASEC
ncbi:hypothetical protein SAY87_021327 [Trapa incisa]|uniref:Two-component response regulator-like APRR1 n=1 Tax=Trapa incisa TaxID=236973 RepID=A0AAN7JRU8_9MYRT|nr:hypothetical protein SAY87_021327 [Trapa incisa]